MDNAIEIKNLRKKYKDFTLKDISFSLPTGYIMGFVGQNGAGKTTTIRLMLNMANRDGGEIKLLGMDNLRDEQSIKQDVGVVLDEIYFVNNWTVREVEQVLKPFYVNWNSALFSQHAQQFSLPLDKKAKLPLYFRFAFSKVYIFSNLPVYLVAVFLVYLFKRTNFLHQLSQGIQYLSSNQTMTWVIAAIGLGLILVMISSSFSRLIYQKNEL